ncbi:MAG: hypothetical protein HZB99_03640 [Candidatus Harrisonbacteria bacterium]|nr:hypothetical protein [Candidatus Harrisonbacteria bacterium]
MTKYQNYGLWALRLGLILTYLYSGYQLIIDPELWIGYLPAWFISLLPMSPELYLKFQGAGELLLMFSFLSGVGLPWTALLASAEFAGILLFYGIDLVSFRDIALLGSALSLFFLTYQSEESSQNK